MGRLPTREDDARWSPRDDPYDSHRLVVKVKSRDHAGKHRVEIRCNGEVFFDTLDVFNAFARRKCREAAISKCQLPDGAHADIEERLLAGAEAADQQPESAIGPKIVRLSDVTPKPIEPLWDGRIYIGKLTLLVGEPGLGKSYVTSYMAAQVSTGRPWPDSPNTPQPVGGVIIANAEDDLADTTRVRLDAHEADVSRIVAIEGIKSFDADGDYERALDLSRDIAHIRTAIDAVENCRLVVLDPVSAYMGKTDSHKNAEVRSVLGPLADLAAEKRVAVVAVTHLRKGEGSAKHRTIGSIAFVAAARAAWLVTEDSLDPTRRLFLPIKNNLSADCGGLAFAVRPYGPGDAQCVCWEPGTVDVSADQAMERLRQKPGPKPTDRQDAATWLAQRLTSRPESSAAILGDAEQLGYKAWNIRRAFKELGGKRTKAGFDGGWLWSRPEDDSEGDSPHQTQTTCHLRHLRENPEENISPKVTNSYSPEEGNRLTGYDTFDIQDHECNGHEVPL